MSEFASAIASGALVANQLVDVAAANDSHGRITASAYDAATAASACPIGRATVSVADGAVTTIELFGEIVTMTTSGTVTAGDDVANTGTAGKVATATAGKPIVGRALETKTTGLAIQIATVAGVAQTAAGDVIAEGVQHAHVADAADPAAQTSANWSATMTSPAAITATSPGTGADATSPTGAQWTAAVADLTSIASHLTLVKADLDALDTEYDKAVADIAALRAAVVALNTGQKAIFDALEAYGLNAAS